MEDATAGSNAAPEPRYIDTPIGGERKARRVRRPLQELDGMTAETDKEDARATAVKASEDFVRQPEFESPPQSPRPQGRKKDEVPLTSQVTLEAISKLLDQKIEPVVSSVDNLPLDLGLFKKHVNEELASMGLKLKEVQRQSSEANTKVQELERNFNGEKKATAVDIASQITKVLKEMNITAQTTGVQNEEPLTIVIGSIQNAGSVEQAKEWVSKRCDTKNIPQPIDMFSKSSESGGVLFAKCLSVNHRDYMIMCIREAPGSSPGKAWAKVDQPIDARTADSILVGFTRMLVDCGYNKQAVNVNTITKVITVAGTEVLKAVVENCQLMLKSCDSDWEKWDALQTAEKLTRIRGDAQPKLDRAKNFAQGDTKGKGKGPE